MPYDPLKDPYAAIPDNAVLTNGSKGRVVETSNTVDLDPYVKAIVLLTAGDVSYLPAENEDGAPLAFEGLPAGWVSPHRVRRVLATGTTATVATLEG